jgi:prephenate dehydrogenase
MAEYDTVAIVGVGLIGGSIGLAMRERKLARQVVGIGRRQSSLDVARKAGAIDHGVTSLSQGVADAHLLIVATPVDTIAERIVHASALVPPDCLITDAGSAKESIVAAVDAALAARRGGPRFIGSHPLAGDHRTGPEHARADMFEGRTVVVTPTESTRPSAQTEANGFWQSLGANVMTMSPARHDEALAMTSHLPHLVATALAAATPSEFLPLTASGWRDTTRIAAADPRIWEPIFAANRERLLDALDTLSQTLGGLREALEQGDNESLIATLEAAAQKRQDRDALGD